MDLYPVTIFRTRYQGAYERATWVALNEHADSDALRRAEGDDITCAVFFDSYPRPIGRGSSAAAAYDDLVRQMS